MRKPLGTVDFKFKFLAHADFLSPRLNTSMKYRADWPTGGREVNLNSAEIVTVPSYSDLSLPGNPILPTTLLIFLFLL